MLVCSCSAAMFPTFTFAELVRYDYTGTYSTYRPDPSSTRVPFSGHWTVDPSAVGSDYSESNGWTARLFTIVEFSLEIAGESISASSYESLYIYETEYNAFPDEFPSGFVTTYQVTSPIYDFGNLIGGIEINQFHALFSFDGQALWNLNTIPTGIDFIAESVWPTLLIETYSMGKVAGQIDTVTVQSIPRPVPIDVPVSLWSSAVFALLMFGRSSRKSERTTSPCALRFTRSIAPSAADFAVVRV